MVEVDREGDHVDEEAGQGADQVEDGGEGAPGQRGQDGRAMWERIEKQEAGLEINQKGRLYNKKGNQQG